MKLDWKRVVRTLKSFTLPIFILIFITVVATSCSKGSKDKPVLLGQKDQSKITGKASLIFNKLLKAELYNGTDWTLTDVDVIVRHPDADMKELPNETREEFQLRILKGATRRFRLELSGVKSEHDNKPNLKPFTTGEFFGDVGNFLEKIDTNTAWSWDVVSARGFKE